MRLTTNTTMTMYWCPNNKNKNIIQLKMEPKTMSKNQKQTLKGKQDIYWIKIQDTQRKRNKTNLHHTTMGSDKMYSHEEDKLDKNRRRGMMRTAKNNSLSSLPEMMKALPDAITHHQYHFHTHPTPCLACVS